MNLRSKGFTLIELLVVISIIGVLATIVISSLSESQTRSRDARRFADIKSIQSALEIYYIDNGAYPISTGIAGGQPNQPNNSWANSAYSSWENFETILGTILPRDPINVQTVSWPGSSDTTYNYVYYGAVSGCPAGQGYIIIFQLESRAPTASENTGVTKCSDGLQWKYANNSVNVGRSPLQ